MLPSASAHALAREEVVERTAAEEADVLALARGRGGHARRSGLGAHGGLGRVAERQPQAREHGGRDAREHVRLILGVVGAARHERAAVALDEARVVAGRDVPGAQPLGRVDERREPVGAVAGRARVRGLAARVAGDERLDDGAAEGLAAVQRDVRQAERVTALARAQHGCGRAAGALGVGRLLVDPEPQREARRPRRRARARAGARRRSRRRPTSRRRRAPASGGSASDVLGGVAERGVQRVERDRGALARAAAQRRARATQSASDARAASRNGRPWLRRQAQAAAAVACAQAAAPKRAVARSSRRRRARA